MIVLSEDSAQLAPSASARDLKKATEPVFVKGTVQSRKSQGWKACVAETQGELETLCRYLLSLENRSRGRVIARRLVALRHSRTSPQGFPFGREYRVFVYRQTILGCGYYWEGEDPLSALSPAEAATVERLALQATALLDVPYVAVDIGQQEDGTWIVIEVGDAQFSGISKIPPLKLWHEVSQIALPS